MLPRIPLVEDPWPFVEAGRKLSELHLGYESVTPYPLDGLDVEADGDPYDFFRVQKMAFAKVRDPRPRSSSPTSRAIIYNSRITLSGIPEAAYRYMLGSRSAIEWIIDRYQVKTDKASGIVNDPNDWSREVSGPSLHHRPARPDRHGEPRDDEDRRRPAGPGDPRGPRQLTKQHGGTMAEVAYQSRGRDGFECTVEQASLSADGLGNARGRHSRCPRRSGADRAIAALVSNAWAYAKHEAFRRRLRSAEKRKSHEQQAKEHKWDAAVIADMAVGARWRSLGALGAQHASPC